MSNNNKNKLNLAGVVFLISFFGGIIFILFAIKTVNPILFILGFGLFFGGVTTAGIIQAVINKKNSPPAMNAAARGALARTVKRYEPLLLDERTKQIPDVQRLLQYTEVQKVFFDPSFICTAQAQNDPNVQELMRVFDNILDSGSVNDVLSRYNANTYPAETDAAPNASPMGAADILDVFSKNLRQRVERSVNSNNKPRKTLGTVLFIVGMLMVGFPFALVTFKGFLGQNLGVDVNLGNGAARLVSTLMTLGVVVAVVGKIFKR